MSIAGCGGNLPRPPRLAVAALPLGGIGAPPHPDKTWLLRELQRSGTYALCRLPPPIRNLCAAKEERLQGADRQPFVAGGGDGEGCFAARGNGWLVRSATQPFR